MGGNAAAITLQETLALHLQHQEPRKEAVQASVPHNLSSGQDKKPSYLLTALLSCVHSCCPRRTCALWLS